MKYILCVALAIVASSASAQVYECKVNGSTVYQGKPCAGSKAVADKVATAKATAKAQEDARNRYEAREANRKKPSIGMTEAQVEQSTWGYPTKVNKTHTSSGTHEQWVYRGTGGYIYLRNGIVTTIQE